MRNYVLFLSLFLSNQGLSQINLDSLYEVWENKKQDDTVRFFAFKEFIWNGYLFSNADTAFQLAESLQVIASQKQNKIWVAEAIRLKGISKNVTGELINALELYEKSLNLNKSINNKVGIAWCLLNIGIVYYQQGKTEKAIDFCERSLDLMKGTGDNLGVTTSLINIGVIYKAMGNNQKALEAFE